MWAATTLKTVELAMLLRRPLITRMVIIEIKTKPLRIILLPPILVTSIGEMNINNPRVLQEDTNQALEPPFAVIVCNLVLSKDFG